MSSFITGSAVYLVIWWLVLFMVLPWGVRPPEAHEMEKGQEPGAPVKPRMLLKILITSVISLILYGIFYYVEQQGWISFRDYS